MPMMRLLVSQSCSRFRNLSGTSNAGRAAESIPEDVLESLRSTGVCLKGTLFSSVGRDGTEGQSLNVQLRKKLDLGVNLVHGFSIPGLVTRHKDLDIVVIRHGLSHHQGIDWVV